jgi:L-ascorbate metabolism protein UlaG (beta-lactamase superfamily)
MDSATVAYGTGALLIGSESTANIGLGQGFRKDRIHVISGGETFQFGKFRVTPSRSPHSPDAWFLGTIVEPLHPPERHVSEFKEGGSYSFLVEHVGLRALIHPSANVHPGMFRNVKADVVFLGIGQLGKQSWCFTEDYWHEVVVETGASLVIPIHWDNFFLPLDRPLEAMPWPLDDFDKGMERVLRLAEKHSVAVRFMPLFDPVDVAFLARKEIISRTEAVGRTLARSPECVGRPSAGPRR